MRIFSKNNLQKRRKKSPLLSPKGCWRGGEGEPRSALHGWRQMAEKVMFLCINTINTKILLSLRLRILRDILCFVESKSKNSVNGVKNL